MDTVSPPLIPNADKRMDNFLGMFLPAKRFPFFQGISNEPISSYYIPGGKIVHNLADYELIDEMLKNVDDAYVHSQFTKDTSLAFLGTSLFMSDGPGRKPQREALVHHTQAMNIIHNKDGLRKICRETIAQWSKKPQINLATETKKLSLQLNSTMIWSQRLGWFLKWGIPAVFQTSAFLIIGTLINKLKYHKKRRYRWLRWVLTPLRVFELPFWITWWMVFARLIFGVWKRRRLMAHNPAAVPSDMLTDLIKMADKPHVKEMIKRGEMGKNVVPYNVSMLFIASMTSATGMGMMPLVLKYHPEYHEKYIQELRETQGQERPKRPVFKAIKAATEAQFEAAHSFQRDAAKDTVLGGKYRIGKGDWIIAHKGVMHRKIVKDGQGEILKIGRYLPGDADYDKEAAEKHATLVFGGWDTRCIGEFLNGMSSDIYMEELYLNNNVEIVSDTPLEPTDALLVEANKNIVAQISPL